MAKGLSFVPTVHFDLFNTIIDINKFARTLTVKRHFSDVRSHREPTLATMDHPNIVTRDDLSQLPFSEQCGIMDLHELSTPYPSKSIQSIDITYKNPDFYPINARIPALDLFQSMMERDLKTLQKSGESNSEIKSQQRGICSSKTPFH